MPSMPIHLPAASTPVDADGQAWLSVLVAVPAGADPAAWCALLAEPACDGDKPMSRGCRVILVCPGPDTPGCNVAGVEVLVCAGGHLFQLWAAAIERATGTYLAVVDARCPPAVGWLAAARRAVDESVPAFFGPVSPDAAGGDKVLLEYTLEYGQFARPVDAKLQEVPGNNFVFRRDLLDAEALVGSQFHKVFFVARLQRRGLAPRYRDDLEVQYHKRYARKHYLLRRLAHGRTYAATRVRGAGFVQRLGRMLSCPAVPWLRLARVVAAVGGKPTLRSVLMRHPIYALAAEVAWSVGELMGYSSGTQGLARHVD